MHHLARPHSRQHQRASSILEMRLCVSSAQHVLQCASHASHSLTAWGSGQKYGNLKAGRRGQQGGQEVQTPLNQLLRASGTGPGDHCRQGHRCAARHMHLPNSLSLCSPSVKEATTHESLTQSYHGACLLLSLCGRTEALRAVVAAKGCLYYAS